jgi:hypothetical protein
MGDTEQLAPGIVEVDDSGYPGNVRVRFTLPQEWFTLPDLRKFAAYLVTLADESEPSAEVDELARILETAALLAPGHRPTARAILGAGYSPPVKR